MVDARVLWVLQAEDTTRGEAPLVLSAAASLRRSGKGSQHTVSGETSHRRIQWRQLHPQASDLRLLFRRARASSRKGAEWGARAIFLLSSLEDRATGALLDVF